MSSTNAPDKAIALDESYAVTYLRQFGYLNVAVDEQTNKSKPDPKDLKAALEALQKFGHIPITGSLDDATTKLIAQPRCGIVDVVPPKQGYAPLGDIWQQAIERIVREAFEKWSAVVPLVFQGVPQNHSAEIQISFATGLHRFHEPFDGQGPLLAHAFAPKDGDIHFDDAETWVDGYVDDAWKIDMGRVACHEIGHAIGLGHSDVAYQLMGAYYPHSYRPQLDHIAGVRSRYYRQIYIASLYRDVLERRFDDGGLDSHVREFYGGSGHVQQARTFVFSREHGEMIAVRLYWPIHDRAPDQGELDLRANSLTDGTSYRNVLADMAASDEYRNIHPTPDPYTESLYRRLIGRPPNDDELRYYRSRLSAGTSPEVVAMEILTSTDYLVKVINEFFRRILRRGDDDPDPSYYIEKFRGGMSHQDFLVELVTSEEYKVNVVGMWS